jgi:hypothetical protein
MAEARNMQFRLITLLVSITIFAVLFGLVVAVPPGISLPILTILLALSPSILITGVVYARGVQRAFFIGALAAGAVPYAFIAISCIWVVADILGDLRYSSMEGYWWRILLGRETPSISTSYALLLIMPAFISLIGGCVSAFVCYALTAAPAENKSRGQ